jgi:hypothetical protein
MVTTMELYYYSIFAFFAILAYVMVVDRNVVTFIDLTIRYIGVQLKRAWWMIRFHPINPIPRWTLNWRIERMTRQLEKDLKIDIKDLTDPD